MPSFTYLAQLQVVSIRGGHPNWVIGTELNSPEFGHRAPPMKNSRMLLNTLTRLTQILLLHCCGKNISSRLSSFLRSNIFNESDQIFCLRTDLNMKENLCRVVHALVNAIVGYGS